MADVMVKEKYCTHSNTHSSNIAIKQHPKVLAFIPKNSYITGVHYMKQSVELYIIITWSIWYFMSNNIFKYSVYKVKHKSHQNDNP